jgi:hypothetical protein
VVDKTGSDLPEFNEDWVAGGVSEASLRRFTAPPPVVGPPRPGGATGAPAGPRDWSPTVSDLGGPGLRTHRRRRWPWVLVVLLAGGAFTWSNFRASDSGHSAHPPITAPSPAIASPSGTDPAVLGLTPAVKVGSCFDLPDPTHTSTAEFQTCTTSHTYEFVALETASGSDTQYPAQTYWQGPVHDRCTADLVAYATQPAAKWDPHLQASEFVPRPEYWATGDRNVYCVAEWEPAHAGSAKDLTPYVGPRGPITTPAAITVTGRLSIDTDDQGFCLAITVNGKRVPAESGVNTLSWHVETTSTGVPDDSRSGIATGATPEVGKIFLHTGSIAHLTGQYETSPVAQCGSTREFIFTSAH